jgi:hypothetical protein
MLTLFFTITQNNQISAKKTKNRLTDSDGELTPKTKEIGIRLITAYSTYYKLKRSAALPNAYLYYLDS